MVYMKIKDLVEAPQYAEETDFWLNKTEINKELSDEILKSPTLKVVKHFEGMTLYHCDNTYACIDDKSKEVLYVSEYETQIVSGKKVTVQVKLWKDRLDSRVDKMPRVVFWDYLLPLTGSMMTDELQTSKGARFWTYLVRDAIKKNLFVYAIDLKNNSIIKIGALEFIELIKNDGIWGRTKEHRTKRVIISLNQL